MEIIKVRANGKVHLAYSNVLLPICGSQRWAGSQNRPVEATADLTCQKCRKSPRAF